MTRHPPLIEGRRIRVATGSRSQTINICTLANIPGVYDWIVRLPKAVGFVDPTEIKERAGRGIPNFVAWLTEVRGGEVEKAPSEVGEPLEPAPGLPRPPESSLQEGTPPEDAAWVERACQLTEAAIDRLLHDFLHAPFRHRVEHSVHAELYATLSKEDHLCQPLPLFEKDLFTQSLHKEWPEVVARPEKVGRRGLFDLALLSPVAVSRCRAEDFEGGWVRPPIAIELGLNYNEAHLFNDAEKLLNSGIEHGYLIHLIRGEPFACEHLNERLLDPVGGVADKRIQVAVAAVETGGRRWIKRIADDRVQLVS